MNKVKRYYATGRRKESIAKVWIKEPGRGRIYINGRRLEEYFLSRDLYINKILMPLKLTAMIEKVDVKVKTFGGGITGQADSVSLGIARALVEMNPEFREILKKEKLLTRDPRMVERKKTGLAKARKMYQYSKR